MQFKKEDSNTYMTIGMGLRAKKGRQQVESCYFILKDGRQINKDLMLYKNKENMLPITFKQLETALGNGNFYTTSQQEYMKKVNENLFGYSDIESYKELLNLLISLRSPKLSKDFKPTVIYEILKDSLTTLSDDDLRTIAESMDNMTAKVSCFARAYHNKNNETHIFTDNVAELLLGEDYERISKNMTDGLSFFFPES